MNFEQIDYSLVRMFSLFEDVYKSFTHYDSTKAVGTRVYEDGKMLYFIHIHFYEFATHNGYVQTVHHNVSSYSRFYLPNGTSFDFTYHLNEDSTPEQIEKLHRDVYDKMNCTPDPLN